MSAKLTRIQLENLLGIADSYHDFGYQVHGDTGGRDADKTGDFDENTDGRCVGDGYGVKNQEYITKTYSNWIRDIKNGKFDNIIKACDHIISPLRSRIIDSANRLEWFSCFEHMPGKKSCNDFEDEVISIMENILSQDEEERLYAVQADAEVLPDAIYNHRELIANRDFYKIFASKDKDEIKKQINDFFRQPVTREGNAASTKYRDDSQYRAINLVIDATQSEIAKACDPYDVNGVVPEPIYNLSCIATIYDAATKKANNKISCQYFLQNKDQPGRKRCRPESNQGSPVIRPLPRNDSAGGAPVSEEGAPPSAEVAPDGADPLGAPEGSDSGLCYVTIPTTLSDIRFYIEDRPNTVFLQGQEWAEAITKPKSMKVSELCNKLHKADADWRNELGLSFLADNTMLKYQTIFDIKRSLDYGQVEFVKHMNHNLEKYQQHVFEYNVGDIRILSDQEEENLFTQPVKNKNYMYVLVTLDRLCFMRARLRNVPCIFTTLSGNQFLMYRGNNKATAFNQTFDLYNKLPIEIQNQLKINPTKDTIDSLVNASQKPIERLWHCCRYIKSLLKRIKVCQIVINEPGNNPGDKPQPISGIMGDKMRFIDDINSAGSLYTDWLVLVINRVVHLLSKILENIGADLTDFKTVTVGRAEINIPRNVDLLLFLQLLNIGHDLINSDIPEENTGEQSEPMAITFTNKQPYVTPSNFFKREKVKPLRDDIQHFQHNIVTHNVLLKDWKQAVREAATGEHINLLLDKAIAATNLLMPEVPIKPDLLPSLIQEFSERGTECYTGSEEYIPNPFEDLTRNLVWGAVEITRNGDIKSRGDRTWTTYVEKKNLLNHFKYYMMKGVNKLCITLEESLAKAYKLLFPLARTLTIEPIKIKILNPASLASTSTTNVNQSNFVINENETRQDIPVAPRNMKLNEKIKTKKISSKRSRSQKFQKGGALPNASVYCHLSYLLKQISYLLDQKPNINILSDPIYNNPKVTNYDVYLFLSKTRNLVKTEIAQQIFTNDIYKWLLCLYEKVLEYDDINYLMCKTSIWQAAPQTPVTMEIPQFQINELKIPILSAMLNTIVDSGILYYVNCEYEFMKYLKKLHVLFNFKIVDIDDYYKIFKAYTYVSTYSASTDVMELLINFDAYNYDRINSFVLEQWFLENIDNVDSFAQQLPKQLNERLNTSISVECFKTDNEMETNTVLTSNTLENIFLNIEHLKYYAISLLLSQDLFKQFLDEQLGITDDMIAAPHILSYFDMLENTPSWMTDFFIHIKSNQPQSSSISGESQGIPEHIPGSLGSQQPPAIPQGTLPPSLPGSQYLGSQDLWPGSQRGGRQLQKHLLEDYHKKYIPFYHMIYYVNHIRNTMTHEV